MTPWQKAAAEQRDEETQKKKNTANKNEQTAQKHDVILDKLKEDFYTVKKTYADELEADLSNRTDAYKKQLETIEFNHLRETDMKKMRRKNTDWRRQVKNAITRHLSPNTFLELLAVFIQKTNYTS